VKGLIRKILKESEDEFEWVSDTTKQAPSKVSFMFNPPLRDLKKINKVFRELRGMYPNLRWKNGEKLSKTKVYTWKDYSRFYFNGLKKINIENNQITIGSSDIEHVNYDEQTGYITIKSKLMKREIILEPGDDQYDNILHELSFQEVNGRDFFDV
jgi:hypothetical protein